MCALLQQRTTDTHSRILHLTYVYRLSFFPLPFTSFSEHRCEYGDLSGRLGTIPMNGMLFGVDNTQQLMLNDIIGRSIVIHKEGSTDVLACGTIVEEFGEFHYCACVIHSVCLV